MSIILSETPNLIIRRFTTGDSAFVFELLNTPTWKEFIGDRHISTPGDALNYIKNVPLTIYTKHGFGPWLITDKETNEPIGMCGLFKRVYLDKPDLGFAFLPGFAGRGFAYEASMAALDLAKNTYALNELYATTTDTNLRSQRLLERCGFIRTGLVTTTEGETLLLYTLRLQ